ncbi:hypothetical protein KKF38_04180 [Patescibacteria group bacterium]|nr:hypothetical protein [Patescibacteria group bacterium]
MLTTKAPSRKMVVLSVKQYKEMLQTIAIAEYERDKACGRLKAVKSLAEI